MLSTDANSSRLVGRFAPTPSGKLHIGNAFSFLVAYLLVKQQGGIMRMRVEDLDTARCKTEYIDSLFRDFEWLGLTWEGEVVYQSRRNDLYEEAFNCLVKQDLVYPCYCSRADLHAASAPHSGEEVIYPGTCRNLTEKERISKGRFKDPSFRIKVTEATYSFKDYFQGSHSGSLPKESGDFIIRRSDGIFAYQLAVVCDDEEMGITSVVRGCDLLVSTSKQLYLCEKLGFSHPEYGHIPLFVDAHGRRLAKRADDLSIEFLREESKLSSGDFLGLLAYSSGLIKEQQPCTIDELWKECDLSTLQGVKTLSVPQLNPY